MKLRIFLLLVASCGLAGSLMGQATTTVSAPAPQRFADQNTCSALTARHRVRRHSARRQAASSTTPRIRLVRCRRRSDDESVATLKATVNEVRVVFTVTDRHGHYIKDLKSNDFK